MELEVIPQELTKLIGWEKTDFICKVERDKPLSLSILILIGWLLLLLFSRSFLYHSYIIFNSDIITDSNNIESAGFVFQIINMIFFLILLIIWLVIIYREITNLIKGGGFYAGTEKRLIHYSNGNPTIKYWKEFTWKVEIKWKMNKGSIILELKTWSRQKVRNKIVYVHHKQMIIWVINYYEIWENCQKRINEKLKTNKSLIITQ